MLYYILSFNIFKSFKLTNLLYGMFCTNKMFDLAISIL